MKDRYTIQIITPTGNMLGSFKFPSNTTNRVLTAIREIFTERIVGYEMRIDDGLTITELETKMHNANKRNQAKADAYRQQIIWAANSGEILWLKIGVSELKTSDTPYQHT